MRVLHVVEVTHGGTVTLASTFAAAQVRRGHDVHVLACEGVEPEAGTLHLWAPSRRSPRRLLQAVSRLRDVVAEVQPDVVHLHSFFPGLLGRLRPLPGNPVIVYQPHSWAFQAAPNAPAASLIAAWERRALKYTDALITNCQDEREEGRRRGVDLDAAVVGVPVDTARFSPDPADRLPADPPGSGALLVCVGRLSRQKGQLPFAAAWEKAAPAGATLVLVGPGDEADVRSVAPTTTGRSLFLVGEQQDVRPWLWAATACVQPSLYEGQSVAMAEALACGVPVLMTEVNGAREAICPPGEEAAGAIVPIGAYEDLLAEAARRVVDPDLVRRESAAARRHALRLFDIDAVTSRIEQVYQRATAATDGRSVR